MAFPNSKKTVADLVQMAERDLPLLQQIEQTGREYLTKSSVIPLSQSAMLGRLSYWERQATEELSCCKSMMEMSDSAVGLIPLKNLSKTSPMSLVCTRLSNAMIEAWRVARAFAGTL